MLQVMAGQAGAAPHLYRHSELSRPDAPRLPRYPLVSGIASAFFAHFFWSPGVDWSRRCGDAGTMIMVVVKICIRNGTIVRIYSETSQSSGEERRARLPPYAYLRWGNKELLEAIENGIGRCD